MKKFNILLILFLTFIVSNEVITAQTVKGSGKMVTETVNMNKITGVGLGIAANVYIKPGSSQKIEIKGQQNIIDLIKKEAKGDTWNIEFKRGTRVKSYNDLEIHITLTELSSLSIGGSGSIIGDGKFSKVEDLKLSIGGSGDIKVEVDADEVVCNIGGSGEIKLKGNADELDVKIGGSGDVRAANLAVKECKVSSAGSGNVDIDVSDVLTVSLVGSGDVRYKGSPKVKSSVVGSGDVKPY